MEDWRKVALLLCVYGVLKELRPLEPYITRFLSEPPMNFTHNEINLEIYPVSVYSNLVCLVIIFLVTDLLRYKPIIVLNSVTGITLYCILLVYRSVFAIQVVEVFYGLYISCEVAYYTYIYAKVDKEHYQEVTGYTRAAYLTGRAISGISSQLLLACGLELMTFAKITIGVLTLSSIWAISLPPVPNSIYFNRSETTNGPERLKNGFKLLYQDSVDAFDQTKIRKYVIWWAVCNGGFWQVLQFVQVLWEEIAAENQHGNLIYNGFVEALCTFMGAIGAYSVGRWKLNWKIYGEVTLSVGALGLGCMLVLMSYTRSLMFAYGAYIGFSVIFNSVVTIAKSEVASHIKADSTGLIFGITMFLALVLQTTITLFLVQYLKLSAKIQFSIYGCYYVAIGVVFGIKSIHSHCTRQK